MRSFWSYSWPMISWTEPEKVVPDPHFSHTLSTIALSRLSRERLQLSKIKVGVSVSKYIILLQETFWSHQSVAYQDQSRTSRPKFISARHATRIPPRVFAMETRSQPSSFCYFNWESIELPSSLVKQGQRTSNTTSKKSRHF